MPALRTLGKFGVQFTLLGVATTLVTLSFARTAQAVPSFAEQTGQPCSACHVGAFGPQLKQAARDFKLYGYINSDNQDHFPPLAAMVQTSFTHTNAPQSGGAAPGFGPNDNFAADQVSLFYAGRITSEIGAFAQITYDGIQHNFTMDNIDIRHAREGTLFGSDIVYGVTVNNSPTVQDLWNSTPAWGFPYSSSGLAPTPAATTLIDGTLAQAVVGAGAYALWNDLVYLELDAYKGLGRDVRNALGVVPVSDSNSYDGLIPYWRAALQHEFGQHYVQFGTYGLQAILYPGGDKTAGTTDRITDTALDANYQWIADADDTTSNVISAHATYIHEKLDLDASQQLVGSNPSNTLSTFRADVSYSIGATYTPSIQYFRTRGSSDAAYWGTANGSPDSEGIVGEIAYVPWGKPDSSVTRLNARLALQYVAYTKFNGTEQDASKNNTVYLNLWVALPWR